VHVLNAADPHDLDPTELCREVAESLWRIYHDRPDALHLIWPAYRDDSWRVSEQESKIVITQWLERRGIVYSVETPTRETYIQKGSRPISARTDVTIYGSRSRADRAYNCELKAGYPGPESFRKDIEKLFREGVPGIWFHTLPRVAPDKLNLLSARVCGAVTTVCADSLDSRCALHMAFCVLNPPQFAQFSLDPPDWRSDCRERFADAWTDPSRPEWIADIVSSPTVELAGGDSDRSKRLVYMPSIEQQSFIHLNVQGSRYALRSFGAPRRRGVGKRRAAQQPAICWPVTRSSTKRMLVPTERT
jgi:hypothetical protein